MTSRELEDLLNNIVAGLDTAGTLIGALDPALIPFIAIGKAVDKLIPGLAVSVQGWIEGNPPTAQEIEDFKKKLAVLGDPNNP